MPRIEKTVFISYRRKDLFRALAVYQFLTTHGYEVFFDYKSISSGDFEQIIIGNIKARAHFLVILTPSALDRCNKPGDWLRREIETAIDEKRNIIPLFFDNFNFETPEISEKLTGKLRMLTKYNGLEVPAIYFDEAMQRLRDRYLNVSLVAVLHPISDEVQKVVKEQQIAADRAISEKQGLDVHEKDEIGRGTQPKRETPSFGILIAGKKFMQRIEPKSLVRYSLVFLVLLAVLLGGNSLRQNLFPVDVTSTSPTSETLLETDLPSQSQVISTGGTLVGPDVNFYQDLPETPEKIDFVKMAQTANFVIIAAGRNEWPDTDFEYNWEEAKKAGLPRGSYWFYDSRTEPERQAELWVELMGDDLGELPLFADIEESYGGTYTGWENWVIFLERLKELVGDKEIGIYTAFHYWRNYAPNANTQADSLEYFHNYPLWIAAYGSSTPNIPEPWASDEWLFWQYTELGDGKTYGVESKSVDLNYFNGDLEAFQTRFNISDSALDDMPVGPDVSFYLDVPDTPEQIDFVKMAQTANFVIIRAGQNLWPDSDFEYNWEESRKAGLPRGSYWFYDSRADPKKQAELWVELMGGDLGELPLFADFEESYGGTYAGWRYWYDFLEKLKELVEQKEIAILTGYYYWRDNAPNAATETDSLEYFHQYPLWIYHSGAESPIIPAPWDDDEWLFWLFTDTGNGELYGVESEGIDLNYFNGDLESFQTRFELNSK